MCRTTPAWPRRADAAVFAVEARLRLGTDDLEASRGACPVPDRHAIVAATLVSGRLDAFNELTRPPRRIATLGSARVRAASGPSAAPLPAGGGLGLFARMRCRT